MKIGIMVDSLKLPIKQGISKAKELGADGIQIYAVSGEMAPDNLTKMHRKELLYHIKANNLEVSALCGDLGGHGFSIKEDNSKKIYASKKILDLALDLETKVVTTHIGVIPEDINNPRYETLREACMDLGKYAEASGACFAIETGPEKVTILKNFIATLGTSGIKVNYDPANLVMVTDDDIVAGVKTLGNHIIHTHAKDGILIKKTDPEIIYNYFAEGGIGDIHLEDYFIETPLGLGNVDFYNYLLQLKSINYNGFLTIEREVGLEPEADIRQAVIFLKNILSL